MITRHIFKISLCALIGSWLAVNDVHATEAALTEDQISSFGCILGGTGLVAAAYLAGPSEAIMLWGGGLLTPSGSGVLALSIIGGMGAAGCSIGAILAPTVSWAYQQL
jgi:hypothetical protein